MTTILFVTTSNICVRTHGGSLVSGRNFDLLNCFGEVEPYIVQKKSNFHSLLSIFQGHYPPFLDRDVSNICNLMDRNNYDFVFFDGSYFGDLLKCVKKRKIKSIAFYHNCEHDYNEVRFGQKWSLKKYVYGKLIDVSEKRVTFDTDYRVTLSQRDSDRLLTLYGKKSDCILPLTLSDLFEPRNSDDSGKYCLLFGSAVKINVDGYEWFIKNVSPHLDCKTVLAGNGFEKYKNWENKNVEVLGFVDDLADLYSNAICVAVPMFYGAGMKTRVTEAMMFGKHVFGTQEAFSGFEANVSIFGMECNSAQQFIDCINEYVKKGSLFNSQIRKCYLEKYSFEASKKIFSEFLNQIGF